MRRQIAPRTIVEAFLPFTGAAPLADIYEAANLVGLSDQPVRLAMRRLIANGDIEQVGRGRAGTLTLTNIGRSRLERDRLSLTLASAQDKGDAPWDEHWRLIAVSVPERERSTRDMLRRELLGLGAVAISAGLYASPHDLENELPEGTRPYLSTATTQDLNVKGISAPLEIAETLWPSQPTLEAYSTLDNATRQAASDADTPPLVRLLLLADALEEAIRDDPLLPLELRTSPWPPSQSRSMWAEQWRSISAQIQNPLYRDWAHLAAS
ncbi:PaaX family transcriptional regulator [Leucobacter sp. UCMA 4100]|uniref:PaaX family transcriptional regulator n=1 Tax=Leucobacter sp. UCMA 4100 TaxID=2810534 RepID=UPI0022EAAEF3|nr:PaaX family transcriptional regulator [Leucobacter sp. UCMA 4100]MDA3147949.1 PaaX family transcriptional regulator [Leucobacter sp. UCMA 4100]